MSYQIPKDFYDILAYCETKKLAKSLTLASKSPANFRMILQEEVRVNKEVQIKNMSSREQYFMPLQALESHIIQLGHDNRSASKEFM